MKLLAVDDARARMLAEIAPLAAENVSLAKSISRVLAEDVAAVRDLAPFPASGMGGLARRAEVAVYRRPGVALLSTGEEIVEAPATPGPFQIYDSGVPALAAMIAGWGAEVVRAKPVRDTLEAVIAALRDAKADLVVTVG